MTFIVVNVIVSLRQFMFGLQLAQFDLCVPKCKIKIRAGEKK